MADQQNPGLERQSHGGNRPAPTGLSGYVEHAVYRAGRADGGVGAAAWRSSFERGMHRWDVIVSDGRTHHYIYLTGELGPRPNLSNFDVEQGVEAFAAGLLERDRLRALAGTSPLHIDFRGTVTR